MAVALGSRLILWNSRSDHRDDHGFRLEGWPRVRLNDCRADPRGSFWAGSMRNNVNPDGSSGQCGGTDGILFRIDPAGDVTVCKREIGISNTIAWSPDNSRFYFADSLANAVRVYDYDVNSGAISGERPFLIDFPRGAPDGSSVDTAGALWNCRYGGSCIVGVSPGREVIRVIEMPTTSITSCTFGGDDLRTLYVTTAACDVPVGERLAGGLFAIRMDVPGLPENRFYI